MPVEQLRRLAQPGSWSAAEPRLAGTRRLRTRWMNGVMFYLHHDVPILAGHTIYSDSDWALTSISQRQFWPRTDFAGLGDGHVGGHPLGRRVRLGAPVAAHGQGRPRSARADEIKAEVWAQLKDHLNDPGHVVLEDANLASAFLDEDITFPNPSAAANAEPLLINTAGSWADRPDAVTSVPNLFLASDFVRTYTDLATMEGANEAARRAVNGILDATRSSAKRCDVWKLAEPAIFGPARALDRVRWALGHRPAKPPLRVTADGGLEPVGLAGRLTRALRRPAAVRPGCRRPR